MVCSKCGAEGHEATMCPIMRDAKGGEKRSMATAVPGTPLGGEREKSSGKMEEDDGDMSRRGQRESPRTPATDATKIGKLRALSQKLSPASDVPPMPGQSSNGSGAAASLEPSNADIMARLGSMMQNMATKEDLSSLKSDITKETKITVSEAVDPIKDEIAGVKEDMAGMHTRLQKLETAAPMTDRQDDSALHEKFKSIENEISYLRGAAASGGVGSTTTLVMGGFQGTSFEAAKIWIEKSLGYSANVFMMDQSADKFKGFLFIKLPSLGEAQTVLTKLKEAADKENRARGPTSRMWVDYKAPIEIRVVRGFLFGLRRQLMEWKVAVNPKSINVNMDTGILQVDKKDVVKAEVEGDEFKLEWLNSEWAHWGELQQSKELQEITKSARSRLASSRANTAKGAGKGPL